MTVWAIADLHLAFGAPEKDMAVFGPAWAGYAEKISQNWRAVVEADDIVLVAGDISWALKPEQAKPDLNWIDGLPGTKVLIKGNHDYWWTSLSRAQKLAPPSLNFLQHTAYNQEDISITGTRLWDTPEYSFVDFIETVQNPKERQERAPADEDAKVFERELHRLELACKALDPNAQKRIVMTHYPPIGPDLAPSRASQILEDHGVDICVFGHLHSVRANSLPFGNRLGVSYVLTSADYLDFRPIQIA